MRHSLLIIAAASLTALTSCKKEDNPKSNTISGVTTLATEGTWKITYFFDESDETTNFSGYNFTFGSDNVLTATNGTNTYTGTWSVTDSNSDDDNMDELHFNIAFTAPVNFEDLTDDWNFVEKTETLMKLSDVSGGNGGTDFLTFEKN
jgi:hypothetical protein